MCRARYAPCPIQNLMQRFQLLLAGWVIHIQLAGSKKKQGHCWKACPTFDNIQGLHLHMPWFTCMGNPKRIQENPRKSRKKLHCSICETQREGCTLLHFSICEIQLEGYGYTSRFVHLKTVQSSDYVTLLDLCSHPCLVVPSWKKHRPVPCQAPSHRKEWILQWKWSRWQLASHHLASRTFVGEI